MLFRLPAIVLFVLTVAGCASTEPQSSAVPADISGRWTGQCTCPARGFVMDLEQSGTDVQGTVVVLGLTREYDWNESPKTIRKGRVSGNRFTFEASGDRGDIWTAELTVSPDATKMAGYGNYRGSMSFKMTKHK
jgi:hypothetical protein